MTIRNIKSWQWALLVLALLVALDCGDPPARWPHAGAQRSDPDGGQPAAQELPLSLPRAARRGQYRDIMGTPRNFDMPAFRFLGAMYPDVNVKDHDNPAFIALEKTLGQVQDEAKAIVLAQPGSAA